MSALVHPAANPQLPSTTKVKQDSDVAPQMVRSAAQVPIELEVTSSAVSIRRVRVKGAGQVGPPTGMGMTQRTGSTDSASGKTVMQSNVGGTFVSYLG